jgi:hypothetical protein
MNVHNILHLPAMVKKWGPLWGWSCFPFESYNGDIIACVHGKGNVCKDVFWHLQAQKRVNLKVKDLPSGSPTVQFVEKMFEGKLHGESNNAMQCTVIKQIAAKTLDTMEREYLERYVGTSEIRKYMTCNKIIRNGFVMYSMNCSKIKKQNSYTILLDVVEDKGHRQAIEVSKFIIHQPSKSVFAVGHQLVAKDTILKNRVPHIWIYER